MRSPLRIVGWGLLSAVVFGLCLLALGLIVDDWAGERLARAQAELAEQQNTVRKAEAVAAHAEEFQAELREVEADLDRLRVVLPDHPEQEEWEAEPRRLAANNGVAIVGWASGAAAERDFYGVLTLEMTVRGDYPALAELTAQLAGMPRLTRVRGLTLRRGGDTCTAALHLETYYALD